MLATSKAKPCVSATTANAAADPWLFLENKPKETQPLLRDCVLESEENENMASLSCDTGTLSTLAEAKRLASSFGSTVNLDQTLKSLDVTDPDWLMNVREIIRMKTL